MSTTTRSLSVGRSERTHWLAQLVDYIELTKPKIAVLVLATVAVSGFLARWGQPDLLPLLHSMFGVFLVAGSASALNQLIERRRDALMERTAGRPLPAGRLGNLQVILFAVSSIVVGEIYLWLAVNPQAALWGFLTWFLYVCLYTPLKPVTSLNTAVGAVSGALPVLIGWTAAGGTLDLRAAALFMILFLWQFPHFMAIAWIYRKQYERAGLKMLTVVDPSGRRAGVQAVLCALALLPVSFIPVMSAPGFSIYIAAIFCLGVGQLICAIAFLIALNDRTAKLLLRASLIYLPALLALLIFAPLA